MDTTALIQQQVHHLYYETDTNCARTTLLILAQLFDTPIEEQTYQSAVGLHGCGGHRDQCGLVEGAVMFLGIYFLKRGWKEGEVVSQIFDFAEAFTKTFGSVRCHDLRPGGFQLSDPPHRCEGLTCNTISFTHQLILSATRSFEPLGISH